MATPTVWVCRGSDCRKAQPDSLAAQMERCVQFGAEQDVRVRAVACLDACKHAPVVVARDRKGRIRWFADLGTAGRARTLVETVADDKGLAGLPKRLKRRLLSKRSGRKPSGKRARTLHEP